MTLIVIHYAASVVAEPYLLSASAVIRARVRSTHFSGGNVVKIRH